MKIWLSICAIALVFSALADIASALPRASAGDAGLEPRIVVALYDSRINAWDASDTHKMAEAPLNHLGWVIEPHDIRRGLPDLSQRTDVRGVLTWWKENSVDVPDYWAWAKDTHSQGKRFVVLGRLGANLQPGSYGGASQFLSLLGMAADSGPGCRGFGFEVVEKVSGIVEFERPLPQVLHLECGYRNISDLNHVYLRARRGESELDLAIAGPGGGVVAEEALYFSGGRAGFRQWYLDPYAYFAVAFGTSDAPVPDTTTLNGRRLYFSHVNGEKWTRPTDIQPHKAENGLAIDVLTDEVFRRFDDLPVTVAPVVSEVDPRRCGSVEGERAAITLFALSNVEAGTETEAAPASRRPVSAARSAAAGSADCPNGKEAEALADNATGPLDRFEQAGRSTRYMEALLPRDKEVAALLWRSDGAASEADFKTVGKSDLKNINGGTLGPMETRPTLAILPPVGKRLGRHFQVYSPLGNMESGSRFWQDGTYAFLRVSQWLDMTEKPRRLKPINVHYDLGSGEALRKLNALVIMLEHIRALEIAPIATSLYSAIVEGFVSAEVAGLSDGSWSIAGRGALQTVRLDRADGRAVDMSASAGVLGWVRHNDSVYVALDETVEPAVLKVVAPAAARDVFPVLKSSRWRIWGLERKEGRASFDAAGYGPGEMVWDVGPHSACGGWYDIRVSAEAETLGLKAAAQEDGTLRFSLPAAVSTSRVEIAAAAGDASCLGGPTQ